MLSRERYQYFQDVIKQLKNDDPDLTELDFNQLLFEDNGYNDDEEITFISILNEQMNFRKLFYQLAKFSKALAKNTTLIELKFPAFLLFRLISLGSFADAIRKNTSLQVLDLSGYVFDMNIFTDNTAAELARAIKHNKSITELNLKDCMLTDKAISYFAEALKKNQTLRELNLAGNFISPYALFKLGEKINPGEKKSLKLVKDSSTILAKSCKYLGYDGIYSLARALRKNNTLRKLNLKNTQIDESRAEMLATALIQNTSLTELNLSKNKISDHGAIAIAEALKQNCTLNRLYLNNNKIGKAGGIAIAEMLTQNYALQRLNLSENNIGIIGRQHILRAISKNDLLRILDLEQFDIFHENYYPILIESLKQNISLQIIFPNPSIDRSDSINKSLEVNIYGNKITSEIWANVKARIFTFMLLMSQNNYPIEICYLILLNILSVENIPILGGQPENPAQQYWCANQVFFTPYYTRDIFDSSDDDIAALWKEKIAMRQFCVEELEESSASATFPTSYE